MTGGISASGTPGRPAAPRSDSVRNGNGLIVLFGP